MSTRDRWGIVFEVVTLIVGIGLVIFETAHTEGYNNLDVVGLILVGVSAVDVHLRKAAEDRNA